MYLSRAIGSVGWRHVVVNKDEFKSGVQGKKKNSVFKSNSHVLYCMQPNRGMRHVYMKIKGAKRNA